MLEGWNDVIYADPEILLERGYDKVILVMRDLKELCEAQALYHRQAKSKKELIELILNEPHFFSNLKRKYDQIDKEIEDPRFLKITLEDWNNFTFQTYNKILDFLEFPEENRLALAPVKVDRDFEGYSCSHLSEEYEMCKNIQVIRNSS